LQVPSRKMDFYLLIYLIHALSALACLGLLYKYSKSKVKRGTLLMIVVLAASDLVFHVSWILQMHLCTGNVGPFFIEIRMCNYSGPLFNGLDVLLLVLDIILNSALFFSLIWAIYISKCVYNIVVKRQEYSSQFLRKSFWISLVLSLLLGSPYCLLNLPMNQVVYKALIVGFFCFDTLLFPFVALVSIITYRKVWITMKSFQEPVLSAVKSQINRIQLYSLVQALVLLPVVVNTGMFLSELPDRQSTTYNPSYISFGATIILATMGFCNSIIYFSQNQQVDKPTTFGKSLNASSLDLKLNSIVL